MYTPTKTLETLNGASLVKFFNEDTTNITNPVVIVHNGKKHILECIEENSKEIIFYAGEEMEELE